MLFEELYGKYYTIVKQILSESHDGPLSDKAIKTIIEEKGYDETLLHLYPKLTDNDTKDFYQLLTEEEDGFRSVLFEEPAAMLTDLQQSWLKSLVEDPRCRLFFNEYQLDRLKSSMGHIEALFGHEDYITAGVSGNGDDYEDPVYQRIFCQVLHCIQKNTLMKITYRNRYGRAREGYYAPYRIEYSTKDDRFRLNAVLVDRGKMVNYSRINMARIESVTQIKEARIPSEIEEYVFSHKAKEPVEIRLKDERNGFDRCFIHLSNYERRAEYDETTGESLIKIYHYDFEETELLITLMSYGPILEVVGPQAFKEKFVERIRKQIVLMNERRQDMNSVIQDEINKIEAQNDVKVLMAVESGSRGWGFPSTDSDYDVRFLYVHNKEWYLNVFEGKDTIDIPVDEVLDINGWDLKKGLQLLYKSNAPLYEWFSSPIVYRAEDGFIDAFMNVAGQYFLPMSAVYHYTNLARKSLAGTYVEDRVKIKKLFYVIRPLFACRWIEKFGTVPPMNLQKMMAELEDAENLFDTINDLIKFKSGCTEADTVEKPETLMSYLEDLLKHFNEKVESMRQEKNRDAKTLDRFFVDSLEKWG